MSWAPEAYRERNYYKFRLDLSRSPEEYSPIFGRFDYIDVDWSETDIDPGTLSKVHVKLNNGEWLALSNAPIISPFTRLDIRWESGLTGRLTLLLGAELFRLSKQSVDARIIDETLGLVHALRYTWDRALKCEDVTVPSGEVWNLGGNMLFSVHDLTVDGVLVVSDQSLLRTWGSVTVTGKVIIQDDGKVISEVIS